MFDQFTFNTINDDYHKHVKEASKKLQKIWGILFLVDLIISTAIFVNLYLLEKDISIVLILVVGAQLLFMLIAFLISRVYVSEKPTFEYLFRQIYQKISADSEAFLDYLAYPSEKWDFNKKGGLFPSHATTSVKRHIRSQTNDGTSFDLYQCQMVTSNGKSSQVHFKGTYIVIPHTSMEYAQIRSKSRPSLKGVKFVKYAEQNDYKVFAEKGVEQLRYESIYQSIFRRLEEDPNAKYLYLSVTKDELHIGIQYHNDVKKIDPLTLEAMNHYLDLFESELKIASDVVKLKDDIY